MVLFEFREFFLFMYDGVRFVDKDGCFIIDSELVILNFEIDFEEELEDFED